MADRHKMTLDALTMASDTKRLLTRFSPAMTALRAVKSLRRLAENPIVPVTVISGCGFGFDGHYRGFRK